MRFPIFKNHTRYVNGGFIDIKNNQLITYSKEIIIWNYKEGTFKKKLDIHSDLIINVTVDYDQNLMFSSSWDNTLGIWRYDNFELIK